MSEFSSSRISGSSVSASSKVSSKSVSSSTKIASSSSLLSSSGGSTRIGLELGSEVDDLLAASASAREAARGIATTARRTSDLADIDELLANSSVSGSNISNSSSSTSSSSKKVASKISSISQSSLEMVDGTDVGSKSSVKSSSKSVSSSSLLATKQSSVDGEIVSAETIAEKASRKAESQKEKVVEDGKVVAQSGFNTEQTSAAKLRATKEMSQKELDDFFKQQSITGKPVESLDFDNENNTFEMKLNDLPEFSPQELTVKIVDDVITIVGIHSEKTDEGNYKSHQYVRRFTVPKGLTTQNVAWKLDPNGILAITAGDAVKGDSSVCHLDCTIFKPRSFFKK